MLGQGLGLWSNIEVSSTGRREAVGPKAESETYRMQWSLLVLA